jgi:ankyrin repeat protein
MTVSRTGNVAAVEVLVSHGANANAAETTRGQTALMWAAAEGHAGVVKALLKAGADLNAKSRAPANAAMTNGMSTYRRGVARIDVFTPFMFAVRGGRIDAAKVLIEAGADANETLPDGTSALVVAIPGKTHGSYLLDQGAPPPCGSAGRNLSALPAPGGTDVVRRWTWLQLIDHGADVMPRTKTDATGISGTRCRSAALLAKGEHADDAPAGRHGAIRR